MPDSCASWSGLLLEHVYSQVVWCSVSKPHALCRNHLRNHQQKRQKWQHEAFLVSLSISSKPGRSGLCVMLLLITTQVAFFLQTGALHTRLLFPASSVLIKTQSVVLICSNLHSLAPGTQGGTTYQTAMNSHC